MNRNSTSKKEFDPFSVLIQITSEHNFFYAKSSNGFDVYGVILTGPDAAICSCKAAENSLNCRHRRAVLARFPYVTPDNFELDEVSIQRIKKAEREYRAREVARFQSSDLPPAA